MTYVLGGIVLVVIVVLVGAGFLVLTQSPVRKATKLAQQGNVLAGIELLQKHLQKEPSDLEAQYLFGKLSWKNQDFSNAATAFEEVSLGQPEKGDAGMLTVAALSKMRGEGARSRQIQALRRVVQHHPDHAQANYLLALALGTAQDYDGQADVLNSILDDGPVEDTTFRQFLGIAYALKDDADYSAATRELTLASSASDSTGDAWAALGMATSLRDESAVSAEMLQTALKKGTTIQEESQARLGLVYMEAGDFDRALPLLEQATSQRQAPQGVRFFHALCLQNLGLEARALQEYETVLSTKGPYSADAAIQKAILKLRQGTTPSALEALAEAERIDGPSARSQTVKGHLYVQDGDYVQAQEAFRAAIRADDAYGPAHLENGLLYIERGMVYDGVRELERYMDLAGDGVQAARLNEITLLIEQLKRSMGQ
jgi:tetratricopeptide (TPR) repeat protein